MTKEVEDIIRNKAYAELSGKERAKVQEWAQNEEEYANMKWFLSGSATAFEGEKIVASPKLKKGVMEHLTAGKDRKGFWLNSVGVFLLPEGKKIYQKPAFQMGMAAVLIVGLLFFFDGNKLEEGALAENLNPVENRVVEKSENNDESHRRSELLNMEEDEKNDKETGSEGFIAGLMVPEEEIEEVPVDEMYEVALPALNELDTEDQEKEYEGFASVSNLEPEDVEEEAEEVAEFYDGITPPDRQQNDQKSPEQDESKLDDNRFAETVSTEVSEKRDRPDKDKRLLGEQKKVAANKQEKLSKEEPQMDIDRKTTAGYVPETTNTGAFKFATGRIHPKAFHISQTKELNALFHIEK